MPDDVALIEASLASIEVAGLDIREPLFERFFATYPARRATFYNAEVTTRRMTDETVQMMHGLAGEETWVWPLVAELVFTHRNYGHLPMEEYDAFIDMAVDELALAADTVWNAECEAAWRVQAEKLKTMILEARSGWNRAMPGQVSPSNAAPA